MFKKALLHATLLAAAIGGPIALFASPDWWESLGGGSSATSRALAVTHYSVKSSSKKGAGGAPKTLPLEGARIQNLAEVFNFDMTVESILRRWPRVSTGLAQPQFQGYRVPLVTGTGAGDMAGSLTYYFNAQQKVQRIAFSGKTGDPRGLVNLLTTRHKFTRRVVNDPGLLIFETVAADGQPRGFLKLQAAPTVKADDHFGRFNVKLVVERPA